MPRGSTFRIVLNFVPHLNEPSLLGLLLASVWIQARRKIFNFGQGNNLKQVASSGEGLSYAQLAANDPRGRWNVCLSGT